MGGSQTKEEEIFINQAGNSGGISNGISQKDISAGEICGIIALSLVALALMVSGAIWCKRCVDRKIKKEVKRCQSGDLQSV
jgi:hypothetical protein